MLYWILRIYIIKKKEMNFNIYEICILIDERRKNIIVKVFKIKRDLS